MSSKSFQSRFLLPFTSVAAIIAVTQRLFAGEPRFPQPEFESGYEHPVVINPPVKALFYQYLDLTVLAVVLGLAAWLVYRKRSRSGVFALMLFSLLYFGFLRGGCVCAVGSFQNVSEALFNSGVTIPLVVAGFFLLPLVAALFWGRIFCAAACPLGAIQDAVSLHSLKVPKTLDELLRIIPVAYLALGAVSAAMGAGYLVCRYDPFIPFFRFSGSLSGVLLGFGFLFLSTIVARPYCRYVCPYGVLLGWASRLSSKTVSITPDKCINCRLCEDACPSGDILPPAAAESMDLEFNRTGIRRFGLIFALAPLVILAGVLCGLAVSGPIAGLHPDVRLAAEISRLNEKTAETDTGGGQSTGKTNDSGNPAGSVEIAGGESLAAESFRAGGKSVDELFSEAAAIRGRFRTAAMLAGGFVGLVFVARMLLLGMKRTNEGYEPDKGRCFACAKCYAYCPHERLRRKTVK